MTAIFLDVDGVLNDHRRWANGYSPMQPELVRHLNVLLAGVPKAMIVLSSAWRYSFPDVRSIETVLCVHGANARGRVHGATCSDADVHGIDLDDLPSFDDAAWWSHNGLTWRVGQILRYVRENAVERYVVLDDLALDVPNLVKTDGKVGLTPALVTQAMRVLLMPQGAETGSVEG